MSAVKLKMIKDIIPFDSGLVVYVNGCYIGMCTYNDICGAKSKPVNALNNMVTGIDVLEGVLTNINMLAGQIHINIIR